MTCTIIDICFKVIKQKVKITVTFDRTYNDQQKHSINKTMLEGKIYNTANNLERNSKPYNINEN